MGCCNSCIRFRPSSSRSPPTTAGVDNNNTTSNPAANDHNNVNIQDPSSHSPRRATTSSTPPSSSTSNSDPTGTSHHRSRRPLSERKDKPLRLHRWKSPTPMTRRELERKRAEFWDTRVGGRQEVWDAIRMAVEVLNAGDLVTAREIVRAGGITVPTGDLINSAYDDLGTRYEFPAYAISDPTNLLETLPSSNSISGKSLIHSDSDFDDIEGEGEGVLSDSSSLRYEKRKGRDEKGKGKAVSLGGRCKVRMRLSDRARDVVVRFEEEETVGVLCLKTVEVAGLEKEGEVGTVRVRLAYLGKILRESETLKQQGWKEGDVVNALVSQAL